MKNSKFFSTSTVSACIAAAFAYSAASAQEVQVVKIGHVAPLSGAQAHYGKDNENGVRMAIEDINAQNPVICCHSFKLKKNKRIFYSELFLEIKFKCNCFKLC